MRKEFKEFLKNSKKIKLDAGEKNRIRDSLLLYVKDHPLIKAEASNQGFTERSATFVRNIFEYISLRPAPKLVATLLIGVFGLSTMATVAAENALPGEFLHPVKIKVNENIRSFLARSSYAKVDWEIERANRRLVEIEKLADSGKLRAETVKEAEQSFEGHLQKATEVMAKVEAKKHEAWADEVKSTVGALLLVHQDVLGEIGQGLGEKPLKAEVKTELDSLQQNFKERIQEANDNLVKEKEEAHESSVSLRALDNPEDPTKEGKGDEQRILPQPAAEGKLRAAENKIEEVKKFLELKKSRVGADAVSEAERLLTSAQDSIAEGRAKINAGDNNDAFTLFQRAILLAQTSQRLLGVAREVLPLSSFKLEEKIRTEGNETEFKVRIESRNNHDEEEDDEKEEELSGKEGGGGEESNDQDEIREDDQGEDREGDRDREGRDSDGDRREDNGGED